MQLRIDKKNIQILIIINNVLERSIKLQIIGNISIDKLLMKCNELPISRNQSITEQTNLKKTTSSNQSHKITDNKPKTS